MLKPIEDNSKKALLNWVNDLLKIQMESIEQMGTGAVYCQLLDVAHPGKVQMRRVNWKSKLEVNNLDNLRYMLDIMQKLNITKVIDIQKLAKMKFQDNFQLLVWFRKYVMETNKDYMNYKPFERRDAIPEFPKFEDPKVVRGNKFQVQFKNAITSRDISKDSSVSLPRKPAIPKTERPKKPVEPLKQAPKMAESKIQVSGQSEGQLVSLSQPLNEQPVTNQNQEVISSDSSQSSSIPEAAGMQLTSQPTQNQEGKTRITRPTGEINKIVEIVSRINNNRMLTSKDKSIKLAQEFVEYEREKERELENKIKEKEIIDSIQHRENENRILFLEKKLKDLQDREKHEAEARSNQAEIPNQSLGSVSSSNIGLHSQTPERDIIPYRVLDGGKSDYVKPNPEEIKKSIDKAKPKTENKPFEKSLFNKPTGVTNKSGDKGISLGMNPFKHNEITVTQTDPIKHIETKTLIVQNIYTDPQDNEKNIVVTSASRFVQQNENVSSLNTGTAPSLVANGEKEQQGHKGNPPTPNNDKQKIRAFPNLDKRGLFKSKSPHKKAE